MGELVERYSPEEIVQGIRNHDKKVLSWIYKQYFFMVREIVVTNSGSEPDAWDVFQDGMGVVYDLATNSENPLQLSSSFATFFYSICYRVWMKQLNSRKMVVITDPGKLKSNYSDDQKEFNRLIHFNMLFRLYMKNLSLLDKECRKMLELGAASLSGEELASLMNYSSSQAAYNKKRNCISKLIELINNDPEYKNLSDYEEP
jgi:DNA-directed RNA polymerase specialized sigma24 family protein